MIKQLRFDLIERIFTDTDTIHTEEEAIRKAELFFNTCMARCDVDDIQDNLEDFWVQIAQNWDLNIYDGSVFAGDNIFHGVLHPVIEQHTSDIPTVDVTKEFYS